MRMSEELDAVIEALAHHRRRVAIACLLDHNAMSLPDLAELVADAVGARPAHEQSAREICDLYLSLYHTHVPKLEDAGLLTYDQESDSVQLADRSVAALERATEELASLAHNRLDAAGN